MRTSVPGVATGLAWTPVGGDILFIEATRMPGKGRLILTGQLGDVMKESAQAALSLVKNRGRRCSASTRASFERADIHIHVPAGATPKDGPSAGVAMFTALASLLTGRTVRSDIAMTGEISLRGLVLPVGGIKEKVVAAPRAGIKRVMLPARNRKDFEEIPEEAARRGSSSSGWSGWRTRWRRRSKRAPPGSPPPRRRASAARRDRRQLARPLAPPPTFCAGRGWRNAEAASGSSRRCGA